MGDKGEAGIWQCAASVRARRPPGSAARFGCCLTPRWVTLAPWVLRPATGRPIVRERPSRGRLQLPGARRATTSSTRGAMWVLRPWSRCSGLAGGSGAAATDRGPPFERATGLAGTLPPSSHPRRHGGEFVISSVELWVSDRALYAAGTRAAFRVRDDRLIREKLSRRTRQRAERTRC